MKSRRSPSPPLAQASVTRAATKAGAARNVFRSMTLELALAHRPSPRLTASYTETPSPMSTIARRRLLALGGAAVSLALVPRSLLAAARLQRRPSDPQWPSPAEWRGLNERVGGNLIQVDF